MPRLRIAIDARSLSERFTSNRTYWLELVRELIPLAAVSDAQLTLVSDRPIPNGLLPMAGAVREVVAPARSSRLWSLFTFPRVCARESADVAHVQYTISPRMRAPTVTTIHDVSYFIHPEWFGAKDRTLLRLTVPASARRAARVIAVSETSRDEIIEHLGVPEDKVVATLLGVPSFCRALPQAEAKAYAAELTGSHEPYLLLVGGLNPRKNWKAALEACAAARREWPELQLLITGPQRVPAEELNAQIAAHGAGAWLHLVGGIPEERLAELYAGAVALVHPSLHEGFGLTPLEAMACGTPVIASNAGAIPEVCASAATLLSTDDASGWVEAILSMRHEDQRQKWIAGGFARSKDFSWKRTAEQTLQVYRAAAGC